MADEKPPVETVAVQDSRPSVDVNDPKVETPDGQEPTEYEKSTLRHVSDDLALRIWLIAIVELCERFTYYALSVETQNYAQRPLDGSLGRGALGLGQKGATALTTFFSFFCYVTPIPGAILADQYIGKYRAIIVFAIVYIVGLLILLLTSIPVALEHGAGLGGFITALIVIGFGTGGIKANVSPLIADQYTKRKMAVRTTHKGERVIISPAVTIQRIYTIFYACINLGCLSMLAAPYMERDVGFWTVFLMCTLLFFVALGVLVFGRKKYVIRPPTGAIITDAFKLIWIMMKNRNMNAPKEIINARTGQVWDAHFVEEVKRSFVACKIFCFFPVFWVIYGQFSSNFVSQAGQMAGHGIPNNLMQNFDPIAILITLPILDRIVYPWLNKHHIQFLPITRITVGIFVCSFAMIYAAVLQHFIYQAGPCYGSPLCPASEVDGVMQGNDIHIAIQAPAYMFIGWAEVFFSVSALEYAYMKAPEQLKSFVQSLYLLTNAFGSAIGMALSPVAYDPAIMWMYVGLACAAVVTSIVFWLLFRHLNQLEDEMNALDKDYESEKTQSDEEA
ncbi:hypothetical protein FQN50_008431 [Emmonsiellopsis sp. PD_5]|nr:hypothetical protein FQN50_008431 [Emmonsiellopsis sp. PD_5]